MLVDHIGNWRRYGFGPAWEETMRWLENYAPGGSGSPDGRFRQRCHTDFAPAFRQPLRMP